MIDTELGAELRKVVQAWLEWSNDMDRRRRVVHLEKLVDGSRIVGGGQEDGDSWSIYDTETGEMLAAGVGRPAFDAAWKDEWIHEDAPGDVDFDAIPAPIIETELPASLVALLADWAMDSPEEAASLLR